MKIPKTLKIGGHLIIVEEVDDLDNGDSNGRFNSVKNRIQIEKNLPQSQKEATLLHEIMHCINISVKDEEIEFWAQSIYQVLKDNGLLK